MKAVYKQLSILKHLVKEGLEDGDTEYNRQHKQSVLEAIEIVKETLRLHMGF